MSGFSFSLAMLMIGVTYLFGITGAILSGVWSGAVPTLVIIPILVVPIAVSSGINPILLSLVVQI